MAEVSEGSVVDGRYRVLRRIGSGGMADVWLAEDSHLQRQVALKVLHSRFAQDREFVERFRREAEAAAGLHHPNVVAVFDRGEVDGTYYIAMQYLEGRSLKELIDVGLTPEQSVYLIRQVLEGARFAHRHGIVHRDLKPQNVIVDDEGKAVVTDFGIARAGVSEITQTGSVMGTPHYLSPEQAQGEDVTPVSDLYSIGVMLYEALAGRVPFEGESAVAVAMKQVSQAPQRPSSINPQVSPALDAVVMRALEKSPGERFQSADAFIAALDAALKAGDELRGGTAAFAPLPPVVAAPTRPAARWTSSKRKSASAAAAAGSSPAIAAILIGVLLGLRAHPRHDRRRPERDRQPPDVAETRLEAQGFRIGELSAKSQNESPAGTVLEQDPLPGKVDEDCSFLSFFCSKPEVDLTVSAGPGQRQGAEHRRACRWPKATASSKKPASRSQVDRVNSDSGRRRAGDPLRPLRRHHRHRRLDRDPHRLLRPEARQGPDPGRNPALGGGPADPQHRPRAERQRTVERRPGGQVIRQAPSAGSQVPPGTTVSIIVSEGRRKGDRPERDRQVARRTRSAPCGKPG